MATHLPQNEFISNSDAHVPVASGSAAVSLSPPSQTAAERLADQFNWREFTEFVMDDRVVLLSDETPLFLRDE